MREIKFKTWFPKSNVMSMPYTLDDAMKHEVDFLHKDEIHLQYTGLKDKNCVEIYEGDIVKKSHGRYKIGCIVFRVGCFCFESVGGGVYNGDEAFTHLHPMHFKECNKEVKYEVVGNIYENKELLNAK